MRICLIAGAFPPQRCGIGDYTERLAHHLDKLGADVHVITSMSSDSRTPYSQAITVHRPVRRWNVAGVVAALRCIASVRPGVVHVQFPSTKFERVRAFLLLPLALRLAGYRVVLTLHEYGIAKSAAKFQQLVMAACVNEVVATNTTDESGLRRALFWKKGHVSCVNIASNLEVTESVTCDRDACRRAIGAGPSTPVICFFGNIHPEKGIDDLLEAFALFSQHSPDSKLLIVGSFGPTEGSYACQLRRKIMDARMQDKVRITGYLPPDEVSGHLCAADICVLPFPDGLSVRRGSFLAAVKHNLPIITTEPQDALPEVIVDGHNVVFVPPGDVPQLANCMHRLAASPELRTRLSRNTRVVDKLFSWPRIARQTMDVYQEKNEGDGG